MGLKLINNGDFNIDTNIEINDLNSYMYNVMNCFIVQKERGTTLFYEYKEHTVCILTEHITHMINFSLKRKKMKVQNLNVFKNLLLIYEFKN